MAAPWRKDPKLKYTIPEPAREAPTQAAGAPPPPVRRPARKTKAVEEVAEAPPAPATPEEVGPQAVFVVHGMGQQVPFQTLDQVAVGLAEAAERANVPVADPRVDQFREGQDDVRFVELDVGGRKVHLYEAYWAPLTEGKVGLLDVLLFMVRAGVNGLRHCFTGFHRWMFGKGVRFDQLPGKKWAFVASAGLIAVLFLLLGALVAMNLVVVAVGAATDELPGGEKLADLATPFTRLFLAFSTLVAVVGVLYVAARALRRLTRKRTGARWLPRIPSYLLWPVLVATTLVAYVVGGAIVLLLFQGPDMGVPEVGAPGVQGAAPPAEGFLRGPHEWFVEAVARPLMAFGETVHGWVGPPAVPLMWVLLGVAFWFLRKVLVEFLGDVAAYVSPHHLDRFADVRREIKDVVRKSARHVYGRQKDGKPYYGRVHVVGHSLGSVAAYDALNGLLNDDVLEPAKSRDVAGRTRLFLTFGSPLDKIAFLFATNNPKVRETRAALAALVQPVLRDYGRYRRFRWVNVHAGSDIISGSLDFYDDPDERKKDPATVNLVENEKDAEAYVPLASHTSYWENERVWDVLLEEVRR